MCNMFLLLLLFFVLLFINFLFNANLLFFM